MKFLKLFSIQHIAMLLLFLLPYSLVYANDIKDISQVHQVKDIPLVLKNSFCAYGFCLGDTYDNLIRECPKKFDKYVSNPDFKCYEHLQMNVIQISGIPFAYGFSNPKLTLSNDGIIQNISVLFDTKNSQEIANYITKQLGLPSGQESVVFGERDGKAYTFLRKTWYSKSNIIELKPYEKFMYLSEISFSL